MPCGDGDRWPEQDVIRLREFTDKGWSAGKIAVEMGKSRNSVIGKRYRLGIGRSKPLVCVPTYRQPTRQRVSEMPRKPVTTKPNGNGLIFRSLPKDKKAPNMEIVSKGDVMASRKQGCSLEKLEWVGGNPSNCRAIIRGEGANAVYCGSKAVEGKSYCSEHAERFYHKTPRQQEIKVYLR